MATDTRHFGDSPVDTDLLDGAVEPYPRNRLYVKIAIALAIITAAEVAVHVFPDAFGGAGSLPYVISLLAMMALKFFAVAYWFMHLKWDNRILTWCFYAGVILAVAVYIAVLTVMHVWGGMSGVGVDTLGGT